MMKKIIKICEYRYCDKEVKGKRSSKRFCCTSCKDNQHYLLAQEARDNIDIYCKYCDKVIENARSNQKFCNKTCSGKYQWLKNQGKLDEYRQREPLPKELLVRGQIQYKGYSNATEI